MDETDAKKIYANYKIMVDNIDFNEIKDYLMSNVDEFIAEDMEVIESEPSKSGKIRRLLEILLSKKAPNVLTQFCDSLRSSQVKPYKALADAIDATDVSTINSIVYPNENASFEEKIDELCRHCLNQSRILHDVNFENMKQLLKVKEFRQVSHDGTLVVNEDVRRFSEYNRPRSVTLKLKDEKKDPLMKVSCMLGEDALSNSLCQSDDKYVRAMRTIEKNLNESERQNIIKCIESQHIMEMVGFATVESIARDMFNDYNWGRIVAWFSFWRMLAEHFGGTDEECRTFGNFVGFHLASAPKFREWMDKNGGWDHLLKIAPKSWYRKLWDYLVAIK